eukprot:scaffold11271_cov99-Isochrysis_galbana.AAC.1
MADVGGADNHVLETLLVKMMGNLARATNENALLLKQVHQALPTPRAHVRRTCAALGPSPSFACCAGRRVPRPGARRLPTLRRTTAPAPAHCSAKHHF